MKSKVKSFTLFELLIVLVLTAIVVGLAFGVLNLVHHQIAKIKKNYEKSATISVLEQSLWKDFNNYDLIVFDNKKNILHFKSEIDSIDYVFEKNIILRHKDTIKCNIVIDKLFFKGLEINNDTIDAISINCEKEVTNQKLFVYKTNDLKKEMNQNYGF